MGRPRKLKLLKVNRVEAGDVIEADASWSAQVAFYGLEDNSFIFPKDDGFGKKYTGKSFIVLHTEEITRTERPEPTLLTGDTIMRPVGFFVTAIAFNHGKVDRNGPLICFYQDEKPPEQFLSFQPVANIPSPKTVLRAKALQEIGAPGLLPGFDFGSFMVQYWADKKKQALEDRQIKEGLLAPLVDQLVSSGVKPNDLSNIGAVIKELTDPDAIKARERLVANAQTVIAGDGARDFDMLCTLVRERHGIKRPGPAPNTKIIPIIG